MIEAAVLASAKTQKAPVRKGSLRLDNVSKAYADTNVLRNISLDIEGGEFVTLLGASGSGKSTLLGLLGGFVEPSSGSITLDGRNLNGVRPYKRNMGIMFQNYALFPHLSVFENIAFPLKQRRLKRADIQKKVAAVLELVQLGEFERRLPRELSGGQQQRVALARSIVFEPPVLLLDEPMGALDKTLRESLIVEMKRIHEELRITFVYVTHDQSEALALSDRIAVLKNGVIEQVGTPVELYRSPATRYVAEFMGESNLVDGTLESTGGSPRLVSSEVSFRVPSPGILPTGTPVTASIRPEYIRLSRLHEPLPEGFSVFEATVVSQMFMGSQRRVELAMPSGRTLWAIQSTEKSRNAGTDVGSRVNVLWHPDDVILVRQ